MTKDWTGNAKSIFTCNGASNHSDGEREVMDYYATSPQALELLLEKEKFNKNVWECACGELHLSNVLKESGYNVKSSDIVDRLHNGTIEIIDFLNCNEKWDGDIITNPPYKCFSADTQCYTQRGWVNYSELRKDDLIMSLNPETQELEWSEINKIIVKTVDENLIHFKKSHMDILCTKDHRMYALDKFDKSGKPVKRNGDLIYSQDIRTTHYIPRTGYKWNGTDSAEFILPAINGHKYAQPVSKTEIKIPIKEWLRFFGLWLADGYCRHTKNSYGDERKTIGIKQMKTNADVVREVLNSLPFEYKEYADTYGQKNDCINFEIHNEQLWSYLNRFGKSSDKFIPTEIKELNIKLLKIFLDSYFFGDGSVYKLSGGYAGRTYRTISEKLANDLQEILLKLGYLSHIIKCDNYTNDNGETHNVFLINYSPNTIYNRIYYPSNKNGKCEEHYTGTVWCVNLKKNGVFLLRRNGEEFFSGNCALQFVEKALEAIPDGNKVAMFLKLTFLESKARRELFDKSPFKTLYVSSSRLQCAKNGDFDTYKNGAGTAVAYGWYIWEKGFTGVPQIKWFN